jgi:hypothetical protein
MTANGPPAVACAMPLATVALVRACGAFIAVLRNHAETREFPKSVALPLPQCSLSRRRHVFSLRGRWTFDDSAKHRRSVRPVERSAQDQAFVQGGSSPGSLAMVAAIRPPNWGGIDCCRRVIPICNAAAPRPSTCGLVARKLGPGSEEQPGPFAERARVTFVNGSANSSAERIELALRVSSGGSQ